MADKETQKTEPKPASGFKPKQLKAIEHENELVAARYSPCGKFLFAGSYDAKIYRWDLADGTKTSFAKHHGWLQGLVFHPDGKRMFTGDSWGGICCWDYAAKSPEPMWTRTDAHTRWMHGLAISPDGTLLATCGADKVVRLWSTLDGSPKGETTAQGFDLLSLCFHPNGKSLVVGDLKGVATDWDVATLKPSRQLDAKILFLRPLSSGVPEINDVGGVRCITFDSTGKFLVCSGSQPTSSGFFQGKPTIVVLDWQTGERKHLLQWEGVTPDDGITMDVSWHTNGYLLATSSGQPGKGAFYCWKPEEKQPFHLDKAITHSRSVSLDPSGQTAAVLQIKPPPGGVNNLNGRGKDKSDDTYCGLMSVITLWDIRRT